MKTKRPRNARLLRRAGVVALTLALVAALCVMPDGLWPVGRSQSTTQNIVWVNNVNTVATGNNLEKTAGQWDAGANSQQQITSSGGYVEFGVSAGHRMQVGLSNDTTDAVDYTQLKYTFNFWGASGDFDIREGWGNWRASGTYTSGDLFRIAVEGGVVKYYKNGALVYTSTVAPTYPLVLDTALSAMGATVQNAVISLPPPGSIRTDRAVYSEPALPTLPAAGGKFIDPTFGTEIMRVTDANDGAAPGLGTYYSTWPTFNADGTKLLIRQGTQGGAIVKTFDPDNFTLTPGRTILPLNFGDGSGESPTWEGAVWSPSDPNLIYMLSNGALARLMSYNISTQTWNELTRFQTQAAGGIVFHLTVSEDEDVFACYQKPRTHFIVWRRSSNTLLHVPTSGTGSPLPAGYTLNEVDLDKSGKYLAISLDNPPGGLVQCTTGVPGTGSHAGQFLNTETGQVEGLRWCGDDDPPGHGGIGRGTITGQALFNYGINTRLLADLHKPAHMFSPTDAANNLDYTENFHATVLADNEGWITLGTYDDDVATNYTDYGVFEDEIYQVALDGSQRFRRLAHTRSNWRSNQQTGWDDALNGYQATPKPSISRDGRYIAFTSNWEETIGRTDMFIVKVPPAPRPDVTGHVRPAYGPVSLPAEGTLDWVHWGHTTVNSFNYKSGVTRQISNYTTLGSGTPVRYSDNQFGYRWTGGDPTASVADTFTGVSVTGVGNGFSFSVPADTTARTLRVYVGASQARGRIEAKLSGSASPAYFDVSVDSSSGQKYGVYTINYRAQTSGQNMTVAYTLNKDYGAGSVSLQAATLSQSCTPPTSPALIISEFRLRGAAGAHGNGAKNEFVELYNNSDSPLTVCASDGSDGWTLAARGTAPTAKAAVFTVPNGTTIPARGHYLAVNSGPYGYSLSDHPAGNNATAVGDITYTRDIPDNAGIALFNTSDPAHFTLGNRLDAVGSAGETDALFKEGTGYPALSTAPGEYSFYRDDCGKGGSVTATGPCTISTPKDTGDNATDFIFVSTDGGDYGAGQRLGAPGPENLSSPIRRALASALLDPCADASSGANRARDLTSDPANNSTFGTLSIRRTFTNNTGAPVTRLRFRILDVSVFPADVSIADLRARTSTDISVTVDRAPCGSGTSTVTVRGTTLEQPPAQPNGGGFNTAMSVGAVSMAQPLALGDSIDVQFLLGVQKTGDFRFYLSIEALP